MDRSENVADHGPVVGAAGVPERGTDRPRRRDLDETPARGAPRAPMEMPAALRALLVLFFLYCFLAGIAFLEQGIAGFGEQFREGLLREIANPVSGLCAGILVTVLAQSSSVTTSMIVGLVGGGLLPVPLAVPMIMGANIGTTITSTLASLGSIRRTDEFRRAFAAATVHDFFNLCGVAILFPLEVATGILSSIATSLTGFLRGRDLGAAQPGGSPIRDAVSQPVELIGSLLPQGRLAAVVMLAVGLLLIFVALGMITRNMRRLLATEVERAVNRLVGRAGGLVGIAFGIIVTVAVQSSSITTSILVPLVAAGVLTIRNAYPITIGANIGTTVTALIASLAVRLPGGLTIALVHLLFNVFATLIIFPFPQLRYLPVRFAERLADMAAKRTTVALLYGAGVFVVLPLIGVFLIR